MTAKTRSTRSVTVLRCDNRIVFDPTTPALRDLLEPEMTYEETIFFRGKELYDRQRLGLGRCDTVVWQCHCDDHKGRLTAALGFFERLISKLEAHGWTVDYRWATKAGFEQAEARNASVYRPRWDRIEAFIAESGFQYRHKQEKALQLLAEEEYGRIDCPTGWGKGTIIVLGSILFPLAKIGVVSKNVAVLHQRLYPELCLNLPSVGIVGGGKKKKDRRVMCYSADSLHHAPDDLDILFVDEGHQACADNFAASLVRFYQARIWMFSASWDKRLDNKDLRAEALAGPTRLSVPYSEGVEHNMIVPIEVIMHDVAMDENPCSDLKDVRKKSAGIWRNEYRNSIIADIPKLYPDDTQILVTTEALEHALALKKLLPDFELVYNGASLTPARIMKLRKLRLMDRDWEPLSDEQRAVLTRRFEKGKLKRAIVTTVWNVGVSFNQLQVLIRAEASGSPINDTQIPGRTSRLHETKICGIVHDFRDQFDVGFAQKAAGRESSYVEHGWKVHNADEDVGRLLKKLMNWGKVST